MKDLWAKTPYPNITTIRAGPISITNGTAPKSSADFIHAALQSTATKGFTADQVGTGIPREIVDLIDRTVTTFKRDKRKLSAWWSSVLVDEDLPKWEDYKPDLALAALVQLSSPSQIVHQSTAVPLTQNNSLLGGLSI